VSSKISLPQKYYHLQIEKFLQAQFFLKLMKYEIFMYTIQRGSYKFENIKEQSLLLRPMEIFFMQVDNKKVFKDV